MTPREVLRTCLMEAAASGEQVRSEDIVATALARYPEFLAEFGERLFSRAMATELRAVMRDAAGSDDLESEGQQLILPGMERLPGFLTIVDPENPSDRYIRSTLHATGKEGRRATVTREINIARAIRANDALIEAFAPVGDDEKFRDHYRIDPS